MILAAAAVSVPVAVWSSRHVGGMRGDSFGAAAESSETFASPPRCCRSRPIPSEGLQADES